MANSIGAYARLGLGDIGAYEGGAYVAPPPVAFPGTHAGDGGHIWPPRANDPRWAQLITDSGITPSGNFIDDVKAALLALATQTSGALDELWKKTKLTFSVTDTSEPYLY